LPARGITAVAILVAVIAGYILGGAIVYHETTTGGEAIREYYTPGKDKASNEEDSPPLLGGLVNSTKEHAVYEGVESVEGEPEIVDLGDKRVPVIDGVIVLPAPGTWEIENNDTRVCHPHVLREMIHADRVYAEGEIGSWYFEDHGWERVLVAEEVVVWRSATKIVMEHEDTHCYRHNHAYDRSVDRGHDAWDDD